MKCPNCGKEAINVNGKYVCLDCGVELTSPDSSSRGAESLQGVTPQDQQDPVAAALESQNQEDQVAPQPSQPSISQEDVQDQPAESQAPKEEPVQVAPQDKIEKPVEAAFVNELKVSTEPSETGSYDFTNNNVDQEPAPIDQAETKEPVVPTPTTQVEPGQNQNEDYFKPNSFDIRNNSSDASENPEVPPLNVQSSGDQPAAAAGEFSQSGAVASNQNTPEIGGIDNQAPEPVVNDFPQQGETVEAPIVNDPVESPQEVTDPVAPAGPSDLDSLLNKYNNPDSSNYDPSPQAVGAGPNEAPIQPEVQAPPMPNGVDNIQAAEQGVQAPQGPEPQQAASTEMPSVESVFGNNSTNDMTSPVGDIQGASQVGKKNSGKLWILIIAIVGGLLLLGGIGFGVYYFFFKDSGSTTEQSLSDVEVSNLSEKVSSAMSSAGSLSVSFDETLDFSQVTFSGEANEEDTRSTTHSNSGFFEVDGDGDVYISNSVNDILNKRTYIKEDAKTFIYNDTDKKYEEVDGFQILNNPKLYSISDKSEFLYSTNIESLVEYPREEKGGIEYRKIKVNFNDEYLIKVLSVYDELLLDTNYEDLNTDNLEAFVYIDSDNRINELSINGTVSLKSEFLNGVVTVSSLATYSYQEVAIKSPADESVEEISQASEEEPETVAVNSPEEIAAPVEEEAEEEPSSEEVVDARG